MENININTNSAKGFNIALLYNTNLNESISENISSSLLSCRLFHEQSSRWFDLMMDARGNLFACSGYKNELCNTIMRVPAHIVEYLKFEYNLDYENT